MLLTTRRATATCRGRMDFLVTVIRSRNKHIATLVNVSVANVFLMGEVSAQEIIL